MAMTTTGNPASVADRMQTYFSRKLLKVQVDVLRLHQFGLKQDLPQHMGARTMRFFKPQQAVAALRAAPVNDPLNPTLGPDVAALTEGVAISVFSENIWTKVDVTLKQYGAATKISDVVLMTDLFNALEQNIDLMGMNAALSYDTVIRNALVGSAHPDGATTPLTHSSNGLNGCELFMAAAGAIANSGTSSTNFTNLSGLTGATGLATRLFVLGAMTRLAVNKAPKLSGRYVGLICPQVRHDLVRDADYKDAFNGRGAVGVYAGEMADIDGCRFVEHTNPFIEDEVYGTYDAVDDNGDALIYSTMFLGAGAYGVPKLEGTTSPLAPKVYVNNKAEKIDPANQYAVAAWKGFYMAMGLDSANIVVGRSKSTFM